MPSARVVAVAPGSPAALAGVRAGDEVVAVNGEKLRDVIAYQIQVDEPTVEMALRRCGIERSVMVQKAAGAPIGLELSGALFDRVRTCDNHCAFCFVHQLPKGMRRSLYVKDDDYRLSFLYGNFTTLTRFTEADLERIMTESLGPLYVSIHATEPEVRSALLRNRRGATSLRWLALLLDAGIEVHGQIVVCPGINDGPVLDDTLLGVLDRFPRLASLGVVPLGVSRHSNEPSLRAHTRAEALAVLDTVGAWQQRYLAALGRRLAFAADEYYLLADRPFPAVAEYEGFPQHENGIGMARTFEAEVHAALAGEHTASTAPLSGHFSEVDGAPADGYRAARGTGVGALPRASTGARSDRRPVRLITGALGARVLDPILPAVMDRAGSTVRTLVVPNGFFGGNIGVTGLLTGADLTATLAGEPAGQRFLLPDAVLSRGRFLDGLTPGDLPRAVEVIGTDGASLVSAVTPLRAA